MSKLWETLTTLIDHKPSESVFTKIFGGLLLCCGIVGIALNFLALYFFCNRATIFKFKTIFTAAACIDTIISVLAVFVASSFLAGMEPLSFSNENFCQVWGFLWSFCAKFSASIVCLIGVMRVINIFCPALLGKSSIKIIAIVDATILLILEFLPFFYGERLSYIGAIRACVPDFVIKYMTPISFKGILLSHIPFLTYALPFPAILICYFINCYKINQQRRQLARIYERNKRTFHYQAIMSLSSFMALYLLVQAPIALYILSVRIKFYLGSTIDDALGSLSRLQYALSFLYIFSVSFNGALNPVVYLFRLADFRNFVLKIVWAFKPLSSNRQGRLLESISDILEQVNVLDIDSSGYQPMRSRLVARSSTGLGSTRDIYDTKGEETYYETNI